MVLILSLPLIGSASGCLDPHDSRIRTALSLPPPPFDALDLSPWLEWLDEEDGAPSAVIAPPDARRFRRVPSGNGSLGFRSRPLWFRVSIANDADASAASVLELGFMPDVAELYLQEGSELVLLSRSGASLPFAERPVQSSRIAFRLQLRALRTSILLLRVQSSEVIWGRAQLWSEPQFARVVAARALWEGLYYGLLLALIGYNGFIYFSTRERTYLLYVLFEAATLLLQTSLDKNAFQYFWPRAPEWARNSEQLFGALTIVSALHFTLAFLDVQHHGPRLARTLRVLGTVATVFASASLFIMTPVFASLIGVFFIGCLFAIAAAGVAAMRADQPNARFFVFGWTPLLCGAVLAIFSGLGLASNEVGYVAFKIGSAAEATILALALANRINLLRRARERADTELLAAQTVQSTLLEQRVAARTHELSETLDRLKFTQDKLIRQERITSLAGMVAGMAHEVGNPLNFAQGGADVLRERIESLAQTWRGIHDLSGHPQEEKLRSRRADAERMSDLLGDARRGVGLVSSGLQRISKIMANLRSYMQARELVSQPTDLVAEIESTLALVDEMLVRRGVTVVRRFAPLPLFPCRPGELNQVFMNIVLNASAAMSGEGRIEITTRVETDGWVEIEFADTGPGIALAHREAIFEPFFSVHSAAGSGTGLGLYLAREIVARHGGKLVLLDSAHGACFVVRLPPGERERAGMQRSSRQATPCA